MVSAELKCLLMPFSLPISNELLLILNPKLAVKIGKQKYIHNKKNGNTESERKSATSINQEKINSC